MHGPINIRLLIYIMHLLDKYNKILQNSRYVLYIRKIDRNFCGETVLEDQKMDAIEMVKERGYRDDNSKVKWENGQTQWAYLFGLSICMGELTRNIKISVTTDSDKLEI